MPDSTNRIQHGNEATDVSQVRASVDAPDGRAAEVLPELQTAQVGSGEQVETAFEYFIRIRKERCPNRSKFPTRASYDYTGPCWIYIAISTDGKVLKIGATAQADPDHKRNAVESQYRKVFKAEWQRFRFLSIYRATWEDEGPLHERFAEHRITGDEWFSPHPDILAYAQQMGLQRFDIPDVRKKHPIFSLPFDYYVPKD